MTTQTEAERLAGELERVAIRSDSSYWDSLDKAAAELRRLVSFNQQLMDEVARLQKREWIGLDDTDLAVCDTDGVLVARYWERVLREKNT